MAVSFFVQSLALILLFAALPYGTCTGTQHPLMADRQRPNIVFILTDDQDLHMDSLSYMPQLKKHLIDRGTSFARHYCTVALCCPSRVSLWTGKAAHNTNVTDINPPYGGYPKFISQGFNENYLPIWLQESGYDTYYIGKLFNAQTIANYDKPHAAGWTGSEFLLDPYTYRYLNATFQRNHDKPVSYEGQYATDVLAEKAHGFLEDALNGLEVTGRPFFLTVAPIAPHSDVDIKETLIDGNFTGNSIVQAPPIPAERHKDLFKGVTVPRMPNFNPDRPSGAAWIAQLPKQNRTNIEYNDDWYRKRLRALQAVDEMIDSLVTRLSEAGVMDNTYVFFSTDNGYSIGQHRRQPGKQCAFEEDVNIPLIIRGPAIREGETTDLVTSHTDLAPTFLALADASPPEDFELDGQAIPLAGGLDLQAAEENISYSSISSSWKQEHINIEMWGIIMSEGRHGYVLYPNHTYKALRIIGQDYSFLYTVWCSGEHELYDMKIDPYQMDNLYDTSQDTPGMLTPIRSTELRHNDSSSLLPEPLSSYNASSDPSNLESHEDSSGRTPMLSRLIHRLDALLMVLKTCAGHQCQNPWQALFPGEAVNNLREALDPTYDHFFEHEMARVRFDNCEKGYIAESEGPIWDGKQVYGMHQEVAFV